MLRSRCYENEQVALKAFDGAIDQLAQLLRTLPRHECDALLPRRAALLGQLFPTLTGVPAIEQASKKGLPADPAARQLAARTCFLELLQKVSGRFDLLIVVDDLQWADSESFRLLTDLLEQASTLPLLLVATTRPAGEIEDEATLRALSQVRARRETTTIVLSGLAIADAEELTDELYGEGLTSERRARIVAEAKGHPLFLRELVDQEKRGVHAGALTLDRALSARIVSFDTEAQELLSVVALAGKPYPRSVFAHALRLPELPRVALAQLLTAGFLRRRGEDELAPFHDRIRRAAVEQFTPLQRQTMALQLAEALEREPSAEAAERARLWEEAQQPERARAAYELAGDRALALLSFARAERYYARAISLGDGVEDASWQRLTVQRGHALVSAGRSAEAARLFLQAADNALGEEQLRLRVLAAKHLIQSAHVDEGMALARGMLEELRFKLPTTDSQRTRDLPLRAHAHRAARNESQATQRRGAPRQARPRSAVRAQGADCRAFFSFLG